MGGGSSNQNRVIRLNLPVLQVGQQSIASGFFIENSQQLEVSEPYSLVEHNYQALKNIYNDNNKTIQIPSGIRVVHGLVGLFNHGNTCYFNSALHCLIHTQPLTDYFMSKLHEKETNKVSNQGTKGEVTRNFAKILNEIWKGNRSVGIINNNDNDSTKNTHSQSPQKSLRQPKQFQESISPKELILSFLTIIYKEQEDCQELLSYLLDMIHEDLNRALSQSRQTEKDYHGQVAEEGWAAEAWSNHLQNNKSIIVDIFQGQLKSTLTCGECNLHSHKFEPFLFLSLPLPKPSEQKAAEQQQQAPANVKPIRLPANIKQIEESHPNKRETARSPQPLKESWCQPSQASLQPLMKPFVCSIEDCLNLFQIKETLSGSSKWFCPKCKVNVDAEKQLSIWKTPNVLVIHLKRFEYSERFGKVNTLVNFPLDMLDLSKFVCSEQKELPLYTLYAVVQHQGSLNRGHYTAAVKNRNDGEWYLYNDQQVLKIIDLSSLIVNQYAYVLFYQKVTSEQIFRQTLSRPDRWPHMTPKVVPQNFAQTMPVNKQALMFDEQFEEENKQQGHLDISQDLPQCSRTIQSPPIRMHPNSRSSQERSQASLLGQSVFLGSNPQGSRLKEKKVNTQNIFQAEWDVDLSNIQKKDTNQKEKLVSQPDISKFEIKTVKMNEKYEQQERRIKKPFQL